MITGQRKPLAIFNDSFNDVTTKVNLFTRVREKLDRTVTPIGRLESKILKSVNNTRLATMINARTRTGTPHLYSNVGLTNTLIEIKNTVLKRLPIGPTTRLTRLVLTALVKTDFTMKVFKVEEKLVPAVTTITLRYNFRSMTNKALLPRKASVPPRKEGTRQTLTIK